MKTLFSIAVFISCLVAMYAISGQFGDELSWMIHILTGSLAYVLIKMILSFAYRPSRAPVPAGVTVSVIIPSYNEDPDTVLESIVALTRQTHPVHEIIFVDDGSTDETAYREVKKFADIYNLTGSPTSVHAHQFEKNQGKRVAQHYGFLRATGTHLMIYDSDGTISDNTIEELLRPFHDPKVYAVCGHINARNKYDNIWTRLQDVMYESAFRVGRGCQSITGDVVVCSGANSMFLREKVLPHLDSFLDDTFFGMKVMVGDDRKLTEIMLRLGGKVKYQSTAICLTDVPVTLKRFFTQQVRWNKSFIVGTFTSLTFAWKRPMLLLWILGESFLWLFFSVSSAVSAVTNFHAFTMVILAYSIAYLVISSFAINVHYIFKNPILFLFSPFYGFIRMFLIFPIRTWALLTLPVTKWGTR